MCLKLSARCRALFVISLVFNIGSISAQALPENDWSRVRAPLGQTSQAIGGYTNGCQTGAQMLEESGQGFVSIRRFRNRFYSQPVTLDLIRHVGHEIDEFHHESILVGDLSLPIGGKMPYGHSSHQSGLDVDFWFYTVPQGTLPEKDIEPPTMVDKGRGMMYLARWKTAYRDALYAAATYPKTARIFVNPVIKQHLCQTESDTRWLHKLRPWWGHDAHFHVRLQCPVDSPKCESQSPIPAGDGCQSSLSNWITDQSNAILHPKPPKPRSVKPAMIKPITCQYLLQQAQS